MRYVFLFGQLAMILFVLAACRGITPASAPESYRLEVGDGWVTVDGVPAISGGGGKRVAWGYVRVIPDLVPRMDAGMRHWGIENRVHWVRDVTLDEDRSQVRTGAAPQIMAGLRNLTISLLRLTGEPNIAAALRRHAAKPSHSLTRVGAHLQ